MRVQKLVRGFTSHACPGKNMLGVHRTQRQELFRVFGGLAKAFSLTRELCEIDLERERERESSGKEKKALSAVVSTSGESGKGHETFFM